MLRSVIDKRIVHPATLLAVLVLLGLSLAACDLDIVNPNAPSEEQVLTTPEGLMGLANGMQQFHAVTVHEANVYVPAVTSRELAITTTLANLIELEQGGSALPNTNGDVLRVWSRNIRLVNHAEEIIDNVEGVGLEPGMESGILALGHLYKAIGLGNLAQNFEQAPLTAGTEPVPFHPRQEVFEEAIRLLEDGLAIVAQTPPSAAFQTQVLAAGLDLENSLAAYLARYNLFAGNHQAAIDAADQVDPDATSMIHYDDDNSNGVFGQLVELGYFDPRDEFGSPYTEPDDGRLDFYLTGEVTTTENGYEVREIGGFFTSREDDAPLYVPGEMPLIRAEAHVRLGNLEDAVAEIDAVRTKTAEEDPLGIGAGLEPYDGPVSEEPLLLEIFQQRRAELFLQGLGLEDHRRLGQPQDPDDPFGRSRTYYPYPNQERLNNPNTPADPEI